jgi:hypothetical protein
MKLRLNKQTVRKLQTVAYRAGEVGKKVVRWTPVIVVAAAAAGCTETLGCYQN